MARAALLSPSFKFRCDPGSAGGLHGRRTDLGLTRHLRGIPEVGDDEGSMRPLERGTESAGSSRSALTTSTAAVPTPAQRRWRDCDWQRAPRTCPRPSARHNATTLQTCTTEYRYDLLGHRRLLVPVASRLWCAGATDLSPALLSDPKTILLICVQGHILAPGQSHVKARSSK